MATNNQQGCIMTIVCPKLTDEAAIDIKQKIDAIINDIPESRMDFRLMSMPSGPPKPNG